MYNHLSWLYAVTGRPSMTIFKCFHLVRFSDLTQREAWKPSKSKYHIQLGIDGLAMCEWFGLMLVNIKMIDRWMLHSFILYYWKTLSAEMVSRRREEVVKSAGRSWNDRKQVEGAYREPQRGRVKQGRSFIPCNWKTGENETKRPSGPNFEPCAAEALKSMATTLPWMPTITQMVYLENGVGHLTASRDSTDTDQTPPPNSMILGLFLYQWQSWERTTAPLCNRALCRL